MFGRVSFLSLSTCDGGRNCFGGVAGHVHLSPNVTLNIFQTKLLIKNTASKSFGHAVRWHCTFNEIVVFLLSVSDATWSNISRKLQCHILLVLERTRIIGNVFSFSFGRRMNLFCLKSILDICALRRQSINSDLWHLPETKI